MTTFKAVILKHHIRADKTIRIKIRLTHNRESAFIDTGLTATTSDLNKRLELKNPVFIDATNEMIAKLRSRCNERPEVVARMGVEALKQYLTEEREAIDFIRFAREEISRLELKGQKGVAANYQTAVNTLVRFNASPTLNVQDITSTLLQEFEAFIRTNGKGSYDKGMTRAPSLYLSCIRALHNRLKAAYNKEDIGLIRVPYSPFSKYKVPQENATRKRAIPVEEVKRILELPEDPGIRFNLAKDCFALSFCLIGMNSADLYNCKDLKAGYITYKRMKTTTRRKDEALISVKVQPEIKKLLAKYKDPSGQRVFNFYKMYSSENTFNSALNKGLKQIGEKLGINDLEFYAARHSWATIAINKAGIDKYTVHEALNHVSDTMKVTDIYYDKDWSVINQANRKVLDCIKKASIIEASS